MPLTVYALYKTCDLYRLRSFVFGVSQRGWFGVVWLELSVHPVTDWSQGKLHLPLSLLLVHTPIDHRRRSVVGLGVSQLNRGELRGSAKDQGLFQLRNGIPVPRDLYLRLEIQSSTGDGGASWGIRTRYRSIVYGIVAVNTAPAKKPIYICITPTNKLREMRRKLNPRQGIYLMICMQAPKVKERMFNGEVLVL